MKLFAVIATAVAVAFCSCCDKTRCESTPTADAAPEVNETVRLNVFYTLNDLASADLATSIADSLVAASRSDEGCISYDLFESTTTPGQFVIIETWQNDSLLDVHSRAPHFGKYVPMLRDLGSMTMQRCVITD